MARTANTKDTINFDQKNRKEDSIGTGELVQMIMSEKDAEQSNKDFFDNPYTTFQYFESSSYRNADEGDDDEDEDDDFDEDDEDDDYDDEDDEDEDDDFDDDEDEDEDEDEEEEDRFSGLGAVLSSSPSVKNIVLRSNQANSRRRNTRTIKF